MALVNEAMKENYNLIFYDFLSSPQKAQEYLAKALNEKINYAYLCPFRNGREMRDS